LNSISDKYLPLTIFLGVGRPGLENIDSPHQSRSHNKIMFS
jgi:hypothetical protein